MPKTNSKRNKQNAKAFTQKPIQIFISLSTYFFVKSCLYRANIVIDNMQQPNAVEGSKNFRL